MIPRYPIRVFCVDDHDVLIDGLESRLSHERDLAFVGRASTADTLVEDAERAGVDVVLLDIDMPGADAFEAMGELRRRCPSVRTIILSAYVRDHYLDAAVDGGAWGYFAKSDPPAALLEGIRSVAAGEHAFGPSVVERMDEGEGESERGSPLRRLTPRETEILRLIGKGKSRADIARDLKRSLKTIDAHHTSIMKKLDIHDRAELALYAVREGLVE